MMIIIITKPYVSIKLSWLHESTLSSVKLYTFKYSLTVSLILDRKYDVVLLSKCISFPTKKI